MTLNEKHMLHRNLLKSHLYSFFVLLPMREQNDKILDLEVEVHHVIFTTTKTTTHETDIALHLENALPMRRVQLLHTILVHDMTKYYKIDSTSYRSPYRSSYRSFHRHDSRRTILIPFLF